MADDLLTYYERELSFLRQMGAEFAAKYPKIASRLLLESDTSEDPHVERLIQAFAFLAARVHHKINDEYPEITESLLNVIYPHYLAPVPSMSIIQFVLDPDQGQLTSGYDIAKESILYSQPVDGSPCRFRTCYPVTLWPLEIEAAGFDSVDSRFGVLLKTAVGLVRIELRCLGGAKFADLELDHLRFFLHGESALTYALYELLCNNVIEVRVRPAGAKDNAAVISLPSRCIHPVGFGADEGLLPYGPRSFLGYRLLQEYFSFPEKFLFFDLTGLDSAVRARLGDRVEVLILLNRFPRLEQAVTKETFRLGCTPIVNLFKQIAEPLRLSHAQTEYQVYPDIRRQSATEVYSVNSVLSVTPGSDETIEFEPFYSFKHAVEREQQKAFWYTARRASPRKGDNGTEVYLSFVDFNFRPALPAADTLVIHTTCGNRDLPGKLPFGGDRGEFELEGAAPLSRIRCLRKPTETLRAPLRRGTQWRILSHLGLNYLSLYEGGRDALQEILKIYDYADSSTVRQQINGITGLTSRQIVGRPSSMAWNGFCRGLQVTVELDEEKFVGSGVFLFAAVLEKFFGLYTSLNSFTQLIAKTRQREEPLKRWPPRAGEQILL
ncbi:MAG: type VI secretion system baseplate subunit TssF [Candidatus Binatia bacterium]|nr:type VI secretion system baseplate subunit TssF [Candidatus Binatia bacterium]